MCRGCMLAERVLNLSFATDTTENRRSIASPHSGREGGGERLWDDRRGTAAHERDIYTARGGWEQESYRVGPANLYHSLCFLWC